MSAPKVRRRRRRIPTPLLTTRRCQRRGLNAIKVQPPNRFVPRYSIVIPTRNGAETLRATLRTVLAVDYDDYEVVVCDNDTSDATRQLIDEVASLRIRYVKAPRPLAMVSNWELAVSQAAGDYVTVLGDDDALLPHAFRSLDQIIGLTHAPAVRWDAAFFVWPTVELPGQADYLRLRSDSTVGVVDGPTVIRQVIEFDRCYSSLPMLYNSVVEKRVLDDIRSRAGRVFLDRVPDIASGFAVAHAAGRFASVAYPMSVAGVSHKSTGLGTLFSRTRFGDDWRQLNAQEQLGSDARLPDLFVFPTIPVAEAYLAVQDALVPKEEQRPLDRSRVLENCLASLRTHSRDEWDEALRRLRASCTDDSELTARLEAQALHTPPRCDGPLPLRSAAPGAEQGALHINTDQFGVQDVADAARLCAQLLASNAVTPRWTLTAEDPAATTAAQAAETRRLHQQLADIHQQLLDKESLLQRTCGDSAEKEVALQQTFRALEAKESALQAKESALQDAWQQARTIAEARRALHEQLTGAIAVVERQAAAVMSLRSGLTGKQAELTSAQQKLATAHEGLIQQEAAIAAAQQSASQLQHQLRSALAELAAALAQCHKLRSRTLWERVRNAA